MSADEKTTLLHYNDFGACHHGNHVVHIPKDYEPIFSIDDFCCGLTLEELLPYKDDPWWQKVRRTLFCTFWLILLLTFFTACLLSYMQFAAGKAGSTCRMSTLHNTTSGSIGLLSKVAAVTLETSALKMLP
ncbi:uncharacterized protein LOC119684936 [Teleopsis dalmanni]|uniref:uncharacterized protein LOC119683178 n=1 Tax=Teleopsis dalmanni TaxID=139649 RepID=UPI0018CC8165|nr:uncharacterized protein LOC119683178 [Teleopsis dalmanni]XP_037955003.1 uncharacterized protein LOC119684936 [Teleopsis dalmanni]